MHFVRLADNNMYFEIRIWLKANLMCRSTTAYIVVLMWHLLLVSYIQFISQEIELTPRILFIFSGNQLTLTKAHLRIYKTILYRITRCGQSSRALPLPWEISFNAEAHSWLFEMLPQLISLIKLLENPYNNVYKFIGVCLLLMSEHFLQKIEVFNNYFHLMGSKVFARLK